MNFVIYHSALRPFLELPDQAWAEFEASGRIKWATDLAEIPPKYGVTNVYAEIGTSFANSAVAHPKFCAALVGTLVKGLGADHVMWGTDSRLVRVAAMADRSVAAPRDPRRHAEEIRVCAARRCQRRDQAGDLRLELRPPLPPQPEGGGAAPMPAYSEDSWLS